MADRRDEFGNLIRRTDDQELTGAGTGAYDPNVGYRAGPEGHGPYGTRGYGATTGGMYNPPESGFGSATGQQQQQMRPDQQAGHGSGQQAGYGAGQPGYGEQAGYGQGQTGFGSGQTGSGREGGRKG